MNRLQIFLYQFKLPIILCTLIFFLYINIFMWFFTPFTYHEYVWRPDSRAIISQVMDNSPVAQLLLPGDQLVAVDNRPVRRMQLMYPLPLKTEYQFTIMREGELNEVIVPVAAQPNALGVGHRLPAGILAFAGWLMGSVILWFAQRDNRQALYVGSVFLLAATTLIGIQGSLFGIPGAWVGGHLLIFPLAVGWVYLGLVPYQEPLSGSLARFLQQLFVVALGLSIMALVEGLVLFPNATSVQELTGISLYSLGFLLSASALLIAVVILVARTIRLPKDSYQRQQLYILAIFMSIGVLPTVLLTIIPRAIFDVVFIPFPLAISLLIFIPIGYFYIIYRRGMLALDIIFSQTAVFMLLALGLLFVYGIGLYLLQSQFAINPTAILPASLWFLPVMFVAIYSRDRVQSVVQGLFFGGVTQNQSIPLFASALSSNPEITTLRQMVERLATDFRVHQALLVLQNHQGLFLPAAQVNVSNAFAQYQLAPFTQPLLRSERKQSPEHALLQTYEWAEIILPVIVREQQVGFLAMSRPLPDGYYNAEQVTFLSRITDMIAVGSEAITLFEASRKLSLELLNSKEEERRQLAGNIHDGPLQNLVFVTQSLRDMVRDYDCPQMLTAQLTEKTTHLQNIIVELREVCVGLYPPFIEQGLKFITQTLTQKFEDEHGLQIELCTPPFDDALLSPKVARTVYHVLLESLTNVTKHAQTKEVMITLDYTEELVSLSIVDRGVGFNASAHSLSELMRHLHTGVIGMFEWAEMVNGTLSIEQNKLQGTSVILQIPLLV